MCVHVQNEMFFSFFLFSFFFCLVEFFHVSWFIEKLSISLDVLLNLISRSITHTISCQTFTLNFRLSSSLHFRLKPNSAASISRRVCFIFIIKYEITIFPKLQASLYITYESSSIWLFTLAFLQSLYIVQVAQSSCFAQQHKV